MNKLTAEEFESRNEFNRWSFKYDRDIWSFYFRYAYHRVLENIKFFLTDRSKILDIGCGTGTFDWMINEYVSKGEVVGIDISDKMVEKAREKNVDIKNVIFFCGSINNLDLKNGYFDIIFCLNSWHHLPDHKEIINKLSSSLKNDGLVVILDIVNNGIIRKVWIEIVKFLCHENNVAFYKREETMLLFKQAKFDIVKIMPILYFTSLFIFRKQ